MRNCVAAPKAAWTRLKKLGLCRRFHAVLSAGISERQGDATVTRVGSDSDSRGGQAGPEL
jgi:hypothetical protein